MREFKKLPLELFIGYDIEQNSRVIELDASEMVEKYPSGILQLVCKRPGEETTYIAPSFEQDGGTLRWTLTSYDVEKAGQGLAIVALVDTSEESVKVLASHKIRTGIEEGLHFRDAETVDPEDSLIARVLAAVSQAQAYAQDAKEEADRAEAADDAVEDARDQAISAIEIKGAETLDSIPSDYTALSGDVSDLKSAVYKPTANLLVTKAVDETKAGVHVQKQDDGGFIMNGLSTSSGVSTISETIILQPGTYKYGCIPASEAPSVLQIRDYTGGSDQGNVSDSTSDIGEFTLTEEKPVRVRLYIKNATTYNNVSVYPMLTLANEWPYSFVPTKSAADDVSRCSIAEMKARNIPNLYKAVASTLVVETEVGTISNTTGKDTAVPTPGSRLKTDFFPCDQRTRYRLTITNHYSKEILVRLLFYTADKTFISFVTAARVGQLMQDTREFVTPENAEYLRFKVEDENESPSLASGDVEFSYEMKSKLLYAQPFDLMYSVSSPYFYSGETDDYIPITDSNRTQKMYALYDALVVQYPDYIRKSVIGRDATDSYDINMYTIESRPNSGKPEIVWISNIHGDEHRAACATYYMVKNLLANKSTDDRFRLIFDSICLCVVPLGNPYGYDHNTRDNGNGTNINRDFPVNWTYLDVEMQHTESVSASQSETQALMALMESHKANCIMLMNRHDTGSLTSHKTRIAWWHFIGYMVSNRKTLQNAMSAVGNVMDAYARDEIGDWIFNVAGYEDWKNLPLYPVLDSGSAKNGTMDDYANYIGIPAMLLEQCVGFGEDFSDTTTKNTKLLQMSISLNVNVLISAILNNRSILGDGTLTNGYAGFTGEIEDGQVVRKQIFYDPSTGTWA